MEDADPMCVPEESLLSEEDFWERCRGLPAKPSGERDWLGSPYKFSKMQFHLISGQVVAITNSINTKMAAFS